VVAGLALVTWNMASTGGDAFAPAGQPSSTAPVTVRYEVESARPDATASVTYQTSCGDTIEASRVPLPWAMTLTVKPGALVAVAAQLENGPGEVEAKLYVNGVPVKSASDAGDRAQVSLFDIP
jgi:hypothetical protein